MRLIKTTIKNAIKMHVIAILVLTVGCAGQSDNNVSPEVDFHERYAGGDQVVIAVIGDSTSMGFGANGGDNLWVNGLSYMFVNIPEYGYNFDPESEFYLSEDFPYISQKHQDDTRIPSAIRLLRTEVESKNDKSKVYNYSGSGWRASTHIQYNTVSRLLELRPKPMVVLINLGINSAKNNQSQKDSLNIIINQILLCGMVPVLVKPNNIAVAYSTDGNFDGSSGPDDWYPMDNWQDIRDEIDELAYNHNIDIIDLGSDDGYVDEMLQYDSFHPSVYGYRVIFEKYKEWMVN